MRARDLEGFGPVGTNGRTPQTLSERLDAEADWQTSGRHDPDAVALLREAAAALRAIGGGT